MSPRLKTATDAAILEAAIRAISRAGPARLTLAHVADEAGLAPATLVQRFGSKRGLLLAVSRYGAEQNRAGFDRARAASASPLAALVDALIEGSRWFDSPEALANHLAFLQMDLTDPVFRALAVQASDEIRAGIRALLDDAVAAGQLAVHGTGRLASAVKATHDGSLLTWAIHRDGPLAAWLRRDLETLLAPYRPRRASV
ncbi:TetR/AcrR family transcriptional regulator [Longimicrobium sp.]|uniref:TetR/AcrR family transcriptional regulator n=1 Tax=Longimicrobium sp. TaxID=2029185 RepID=UPI002C2A09C8|nr:TetR/AcrR family transcriptional regulator [Longimicrobium sp.]HSU17001.1 TetR/AcrR family transcriptional regulator [Longimicrobium sp.]